MDADAASNVKALEQRQAEAANVGERVSEIKSFLEEFQVALKTKVEAGAEGIDGVHKLLETMDDIVRKNPMSARISRRCLR